MKSRKKSTLNKKGLRKKKKNSRLFYLYALFFLIIALPIVVSVTSQSQRFLQFASNTLSAPPLYGCLHTGEADKTLCGSRLGTSSWSQSLTLHGRPLEKQTVYYGDRLKGSLVFSNVGDLAILINHMGIAAQAAIEKYHVDFLPKNGQMTLEAKKDVSLDNTSYKFKHPDPNGEWNVSATVTNSDGQSLLTDNKKITIKVNSTCTALRVLELTDQDKSNLQTYCGKNPTSPLCTSRQYCEIFKGSNCTQPNVSEEKPKPQCDENVILDQPEQDLLEELCKAYPGTDACVGFCDRSINAAICPPQYIAAGGVEQQNENNNKSVAGIMTVQTAQAAAPVCPKDGKLYNLNTCQVCENQKVLAPDGTGCCYPKCDGASGAGVGTAPTPAPTAKPKPKKATPVNRKILRTRANCPVRNKDNVCCAVGRVIKAGLCAWP